MSKLRLIYNGAIFILICNGLPALATVYDSDGSSTNIQYIHDTLAQNGDTITLPAGTFTWTTGVTITKLVNFVGQGQALTTLIDNVPKPGVLLTFNTPAYTNSTTPFPNVHDFTIVGQAADPQVFNRGILNVGGLSHAFRVHDITFNQPTTGCMITDGDVWGVIDHVFFDCTGFHQAVQIHHGSWNGVQTGWGDGSWEDSLHLGTNRGVYIEDCIDNGPAVPGTGLTDSTFGGRWVVRHCTIYNDQIGMHGTEGTRIRGCRSFEIYDNDFIINSANNGGIFFNSIHYRSGTGVVYNNHAFAQGAGNGYRYFLNFIVYRALVNGVSCSGNNFGVPWGIMTGSNVWDGNQDSSGYPGIDQLGRGTCPDQIRGDNPINQTTGTASWPRNALEPLYEWNNTLDPLNNDTNQKLHVQCTDPTVQAGRDYFANTQMPGYVAFQYPHPLITGQAQSPTPPPTPTATATATATATVPPSPSPTPSPIATATATATPRHTPRPHPSHTPG